MAEQNQTVKSKAERAELTAKDCKRARMSVNCTAGLNTRTLRKRKQQVTGTLELVESAPYHLLCTRFRLVLCCLCFQTELCRAGWNRYCPEVVAGWLV